MMKTAPDTARSFYDDGYKANDYAPRQQVHNDSFREQVAHFIATHSLEDKRCLEVGCGRGWLQDLVEDYIGIDLATSAGAHVTRPFAAASAEQLPFQDNSFDALWSIWVFEHVPDLEQAMREVRRVTRPGGLLFLAPAWRCRPWLADGYPVRPYSDFGMAGKLIKASIPLRESRLFKAATLLPKRLARHSLASAAQRPTRLRIRTLQPNYTTYWMPDSDAVNSIDPHEFILWFTSRGDECVSHPTGKSQIFGEKQGVILRVNK